VDREHRLNAALLRSGKFKEAIATLMEWMRKMDDTLAEQKLTSTDYKFLKSQLQMQQVSSSSNSSSSNTSSSLVHVWSGDVLGSLVRIHFPRLSNKLC